MKMIKAAISLALAVLAGTGLLLAALYLAALGKAVAGN